MVKRLEFKDLENQEIKFAKTAPLLGVDFLNTNTINEEQNSTKEKKSGGLFKAIFKPKAVEKKPEIYTREDTIPPKWALIKAENKPLSKKENVKSKKEEKSLDVTTDKKELKKTQENFYTFVPPKELNENQRIKLEINKPKKAPKKSKPKKAKKEVETGIVMPKVEKPTVKKITKVKPKKVRKPHSPFQIFTWVLGVLTLPFVFFFSLVLFFGEETWLEKLVMLLIFLMVFALSAGPMYVGGYVSITGQTTIFKAKFLRKNPRNAQAFGVVLFLFGAVLFYELFWKQLFGVII